MRECFRHKAGMLFLSAWAAAALAVALAPFVFRDAAPLWGIVPAPLIAGAVLIGVMLPAYLVYYGRYWPYR